MQIPYNKTVEGSATSPPDTEHHSNASSCDSNDELSSLSTCADYASRHIFLPSAFCDSSNALAWYIPYDADRKEQACVNPICIFSPCSAFSYCVHSRFLLF